MGLRRYRADRDMTLPIIAATIIAAGIMAFVANYGQHEPPAPTTQETSK